MRNAKRASVVFGALTVIASVLPFGLFAMGVFSRGFGIAVIASSIWLFVTPILLVCMLISVARWSIFIIADANETRVRQLTVVWSWIGAVILTVSGLLLAMFLTPGTQLLHAAIALVLFVTFLLCCVVTLRFLCRCQHRRTRRTLLLGSGAAILAGALILTVTVHASYVAMYRDSMNRLDSFASSRADQANEVAATLALSCLQVPVLNDRLDRLERLAERAAPPIIADVTLAEFVAEIEESRTAVADFYRPQCSRAATDFTEWIESRGDSLNDIDLYSAAPTNLLALAGLSGGVSVKRDGAKSDGVMSGTTSLRDNVLAASRLSYFEVNRTAAASAEHAVEAERRRFFAEQASKREAQEVWETVRAADRKPELLLTKSVVTSAGSVIAAAEAEGSPDAEHLRRLAFSAESGSRYRNEALDRVTEYVAAASEMLGR